jgi:hypothetical protein
MFKITLINMPFGDLRIPSIGLTQLKAVLDEEYEGRIAVDIHYCSHDFAHYLGLDLYNSISGSMDHHNAGMGDWLFRQVAFPLTEENSEEYFERYYPFQNKEADALKKSIREKRAGLGDFTDELIDRNNFEEADIVGLTSMFMQNVASFAMARKLKERNPHLVTVIGGANCESPMGQEIVLNVEQIDYAFSGPGLKSFPAFVRARVAGDLEKCDQINGVLSRRNCGLLPAIAPVNPHLPVAAKSFVQLGHVAVATIAKVLAAESVAATIDTFGEELDIDTEVKLDYELFLDTLERNFPNKQVEPILLFETSRGCWWGEKAHCTFCGLNGGSMNYRAMSPGPALKLFNSLFQYSDRCSVYNCVDNILAKNYLTDVFPYLNPPSNIHMFYEVKADLSETDMEVLSKARVKSVQPGVESLATSTLKLMKKGTSSFQNVSLLKNCLIYDIWPEWNLLVGFPGEGDEVYEKYLQDLPLLRHLPPPSGVLPVRYDRYSPYYVKAKEYQLELQPVDFYELIYPFSSESLANLAYYFTDTNLRAKYFLTLMKWLGKVRETFAVWKELWPEGQSKHPELYFKNDGETTLIHDSRSGEVVEYPISEVSRQMLELLSKRQRIGNLTEELGHLPNFDAPREIAILQAKGLLFHERESYLSLVLPHELPSFSVSP